MRLILALVIFNFDMKIAAESKRLDQTKKLSDVG